MRPLLVLGWGLAGVVAAAPTAGAQFAADRAARSPAPAAPGSPAAAFRAGGNTMPLGLAAPQGAPAALPGLSQIATQPAAPAAPPPSTHPWYVRPDHGQWMICVKSYSGPMAKTLAEELAKEIRETYRVEAHLFEKGSEERKAQDEIVAQERARQVAEQQSFRDVADKVREEKLKNGMDFMESAPKIRVPKYSGLSEQWAVLIGGWKDMDAARKNLDRVRAWQPPKNADLMDRGVITRSEKGGQASGEVAVINPFRYAMVVPNPVVGVDKDGAKAEVFALLQKLNEKEDLSVLRISKPYTLAVKTFSAAVRVRGKDGEKSVVERLFGKDEGAKELEAAAYQAVSLAKALRDPKFKPHPFDAYVLHMQYGSLVCVGQFEGDRDPALLATHRELERLTFNVQRQDEYAMKSNVQLFDPMFALPVPRAR